MMPACSSSMSPHPVFPGVRLNRCLEVITTLKGEGVSILFISHKLDEIFAISDRITVLRDGQHVGTYPKDELTEEQLISLMVGRKLRYIEYERNPIGSPILEVKGLSKQGNFADISFTLHRGEILGITGLVGGRPH